MNNTILNIIVLVHFFFVLFMVLTPFIGNNYFLLLHSIITPFIILHWLINDNTCILTLIEKTIRTKIYGTVPDSDECISYKLIAPVYDFKKNNTDMSTVIYIITIGLLSVSVGKLFYKYRSGQISSLYDLFCK
jgi:hypothetical protein